MRTRRALLAALALLGLACSTLLPGAATPTAPAPTAPALTAVPATATLQPNTATPAATEPEATPTAIPAAYVPPECAGTPAATLPAATTLAEPTSSLAEDTPLSTADQLSVLDDVIAVVEKSYLYPDYNGVDWPSLAADFRQSVAAGMDTATFYTQTLHLITQLGDEHSYFESPVEVAADEAALAGHNDYVGVGAVAQYIDADNHVTILETLPGGPAANGGMMAHDSLLALDGLPMVEGDQAHLSRLRGPDCSAVVLTLQTPGEAPRNVTFIRAHVNSSLAVDSQLVPTTDGSRIGYLFLLSFFDDTFPDQVKQALDSFGPLDGLIIDNRMNGGGASTVMVPILSYFTSGVVGHFVSRTAQRELSVQADPVQNSQSVPLAVLVGTNTVSFGEIFSGILQDTGRAKVVGETTLGNVETLHGYSFKDGSQLWLAEERFDPLISHANWEQTGIVPDVQASAPWDTFTFENDPTVAAAVQLLGHK
jgi:carboxyl-terminal processing protease